MGQMANEVRAAVEDAIKSQSAVLAAKAMEAKLEAETLDVTIPGKTVALGHKHPMYTVLDEIKEIFINMGFEIMDGPEIEQEDYNFTKLNTPDDHPAREWSDTFYLDPASKTLLRTQTSPMQIRAMETYGVPIRMISSGRVYRKDEVDATHSPMFHQIEGLVVDKGVTMADLKGTLNAVIREILRPRHPDPLPPPSLPLHRAQLRDGHPVPQVRRKGLPHLQGRGLDRGAGRRHGPPQGAEKLRRGPGRVLWLRLRHGPGAPGHGPVQDQRPALDLRKRYPFPGAVLTLRQTVSRISRSSLRSLLYEVYLT